MALRRLLSTTLVLLSFAAAPAEAQRRPAPIQPEPNSWPWPPPDPKSWWDDKWPKIPEAADPLAGRRLGRGDRPTPVDNAYDPLLYRLWGLQPLQNQVVRSGEMILEVAVRPSTSVRQSLIRITVRRDGDVFVQGRAGLGCCEAEIGRFVRFDVKAPAGSAGRFLALRDLPLWDSPRDVRVSEGGGTSDAVCIDGTAYGLTLLVPGRSRALRRACDSAEVGQAAQVLEAAFAVALGHDARFDVIFPGGADFSAARRAYEQLIAQGGSLRPAPNSRPQAAEAAPPVDEAP